MEVECCWSEKGDQYIVGNGSLLIRGRGWDREQSRLSVRSEHRMEPKRAGRSCIAQSASGRVAEPWVELIPPLPSLPRGRDAIHEYPECSTALDNAVPAYFGLLSVVYEYMVPDCCSPRRTRDAAHAPLTCHHVQEATQCF